jgi:hypothetical protein
VGQISPQVTPFLGPSNPSEPELLSALEVKPATGRKMEPLQFIITDSAFFDYEKRQRIEFDVSPELCDQIVRNVLPVICPQIT